MHQSVLDWVRSVTQYIEAWRVLEVGSLDVNGSVRQFFKGDYLGLDMRRGAGVDVQGYGAALPLADRCFELVVSTEMLEHDPTPWLSVAEMYRVLAPYGKVLITARGYDERGAFPIHDYPGDHWRFSTTGMGGLLSNTGFVDVVCVNDPEAPGIFALATRPAHHKGEQ